MITPFFFFPKFSNKTHGLEIYEMILPMFSDYYLVPEVCIYLDLSVYKMQVRGKKRIKPNVPPIRSGTSV